MGIGIHVRIDAHRDRRGAADNPAPRLDPLKFRFALDVERADAALDAEVDLGVGLADAGEYDASRVAAGPEHALEFTRRDDVEAGAELCQAREDAQVAVRLHRVADAVIDSLERGVQGLVAVAHVGP